MILQEIVQKRKLQLAREKADRPLSQLKMQLESVPRAKKTFYQALSESKTAVIAEVKKASPSKGVICPEFHPTLLAEKYQAAGVDAISVLTEEHYFQGCGNYLRQVRQAVTLPLLRKDFIIDSYQIYEARYLGADAILLIAAILKTEQLKEFKALAESLGMDCLAEAHDQEEMQRVLQAGFPIIGINNRNLKNFQVNLETTAALASHIPQEKLIVSESGIATRQDMEYLEACGVNAVLIGETFMRSNDILLKLKMLRGE